MSVVVFDSTQYCKFPVVGLASPVTPPPEAMLAGASGPVPSGQQRNSLGQASFAATYK